MHMVAVRAWSLSHCMASAHQQWLFQTPRPWWWLRLHACKYSTALVRVMLHCRLCTDLPALQPVKTFTTPGFCFVHVGNAFESEGGTTLDVDLGVFESASILNDLKMSALRQGPEEGRDVTGCQYMRLSLPLSDADPDAADGSSILPVSVYWASRQLLALGNDWQLSCSCHWSSGDSWSRVALSPVSCKRVRVGQGVRLPHGLDLHQ